MDVWVPIISTLALLCSIDRYGRIVAITSLLRMMGSASITYQLIAIFIVNKCGCVLWVAYDGLDRSVQGCVVLESLERNASRLGAFMMLSGR